VPRSEEPIRTASVEAVPSNMDDRGTPIVKLKAIALASVFAMSSTLALAQGVGSIEVPITAPPGSGNGGSGVQAPGTPALERAQRAAPQRDDHWRRRAARQKSYRAQASRKLDDRR
jgi:hypothetical protein